MMTQRATVPLTTMSTKAAAFTIDELLRPDARKRTDNNSAQDDLLQQKFITQRRRAIECSRPRDFTVGDEVDFSVDLQTSSAQPSVACHLETLGLWRGFNRLGLTEMIITKSGRRMFPPLRVRFSGLNDNGDDTSYCYDVMLDILPVDAHRYRYAYHRSSWVISDRVPSDGATDALSVDELARSYRHPDGPFSASQLTQRAVSFDRVKLTNNRTINKNGYIVVESMRKYWPRVRVLRRRPDTSTLTAAARTSSHYTADSLNHDEHTASSTFLCSSWILTECVFITVTAYQNQLMTKLKIDSNPFAKGFRDICRFGGLSVVGSYRRADKQVLVASKYFGRSVDELDSVKDSRSHGLVRDDGDLSNMMHLTANVLPTSADKCLKSC